jgi:hypothetical protein
LYSQYRRLGWERISNGLQNNHELPGWSMGQGREVILSFRIEIHWNNPHIPSWANGMGFKERVSP